MSNIIGAWEAKLQSPLGVIDILLEFSEGADGIEGQSTASGETVALKSLEVAESENGVTVKFGVDVTKPLPIHLDFDLAFESDTLSGSAKAGMLMPNGPVTGSRRS